MGKSGGEDDSLDKDGGEPDGAENEAEVMQLIGDKVRKYRRQKGLSQERLGELVGFSQSKISKIENDDWGQLERSEAAGGSVGSENRGADYRPQ